MRILLVVLALTVSVGLPRASFAEDGLRHELPRGLANRFSSADCRHCFTLSESK